MLNKQGSGKIDWTDWTWNPISGCKHGCPYCYMLRMEKRFSGIMDPKFRPEYIERFKHVRKVKSGDKIFVGSSGDMWGDWVPDEWISAVLETTESRPDVIFQFLTKNPREYSHWNLFDFPNCWFGATDDGTRHHNITNLLSTVTHYNIRFVSFEPLLYRPQIIRRQMEQLDWIIIGADSTRGAEKPPKAWADELIKLAHYCNTAVWVKDNYGYPETIKEFPSVPNLARAI